MSSEESQKHIYVQEHQHYYYRYYNTLKAIYLSKNVKYQSKVANKKSMQIGYYVSELKCILAGWFVYNLILSGSSP